MDEPILLLRLSKGGTLPESVRRYLDTDDGHQAREAYKCRMRDPWYAVPDVQVPDFFLSYMSGLTANLVRNAASATCTNSVHAVRVRDRSAIGRVVDGWDTDIVRLSRELEGHPLGGGMLKLEPREASRILLPAPALLPELQGSILGAAVSEMRRWRHHADK